MMVVARGTNAGPIGQQGLRLNRGFRRIAWAAWSVIRGSPCLLIERRQVALRVASYRTRNFAVRHIRALIFGRRWFAGLALLIAAGCATPHRNIGPAEGLARKAQVQDEPSTFGRVPSRRVVTPHYLIQTTITDAELRANIAQIMEGALGQYRKLTPGIAMSQEPMQCFVFANRNQWAQFTETVAGDDAKIYLKINRGGYSIRDWYVAYFIGDRETYSVTAHEGFHQYVGRHFKRRPPPFLEEGLATLFEYIDWEKDLPRWRWAVNPNRLNGLERTLKQNLTMPLSEICQLHAGQVVNKAAWRLETFYAQAWAFARFLYDGEGGKYRPALQQMLADLAADAAASAGGTGAKSPAMWDPRTARPLLEHYLGQDLKVIDEEYKIYMKKIVADAYLPAQEN